MQWWRRLSRLTTWPNGEWGYSTGRHMLEPVRPEAMLPGRALYLPIFSHFLIINKTSLSVSLALRVEDEKEGRGKRKVSGKRKAMNEEDPGRDRREEEEIS